MKTSIHFKYCPVPTIFFFWQILVSVVCGCYMIVGEFWDMKKILPRCRHKLLQGCKIRNRSDVTTTFINRTQRLIGTSSINLHPNLTRTRGFVTIFRDSELSVSSQAQKRSSNKGQVVRSSTSRPQNASRVESITAWRQKKEDLFGIVENNYEWVNGKDKITT